MTKVRGQIVAPCWLVLTIDGEDVGNAFSADEIEGINEVFERYRDAYQGIVLQSVGRRFFCAGGQLKKYRKMDRKQGLKANRKIRKFLQQFSQLDIPTVAIVDGDCLGGGLELISAFDHVISTPQSFFGFWQRRIGLTFGWQGGQRLVRRMGEAQLRAHSLKASIVSSQQAFRLGLVDEVVPRSFALDSALRWLNGQDKLSKFPVGFIKGAPMENEVKFFEKIWFFPSNNSTRA